MRDKFGLDGAMIGRASIGYPWIFNEIKYYLETGNHLQKPTIKERVAICKEHLMHSINWKGEILGVVEMKRHYSNYFKGIPDFKNYRMKIVTSNDINEILDTLDEVTLRFDDVVF